MGRSSTVLVVILASVLFTAASSLRWHAGCLCELPNDATAAEAAVEAAGGQSVAPEALFGAKHFRYHGDIKRFCPCSIDTVQELNRQVIGPRLAKLLPTAFFRYFRVDLDAECHFWDADGYCTIRDCSVDEADEAQQAELADIDTQRDHDLIHDNWPSEVDASWTNEAENAEFHYVDLLKNPERYTGYRREAGASHVWHEIHAYNTVHSREVAPVAAASDNDDVDLGNEESEDALDSMSTEARLFYKVVSGMHASVSSHIAAGYLLDKEAGVWGLDLDQYERRLGVHPERLHNLYFAYLLVLHAVDAAGDFLLDEYDLSTLHHPEDDRIAREELRALLASRPAWPVTFDEESAFSDTSLGAAGGSDAREAVLASFRQQFYNISRIMDCVGCQRCRLWGKLQVMGYGVALRLLYAPDREVVLRALQRNHIVALLNLLGRLSHSVEVARVVLPLLQHVDDRDGAGMRTRFGRSALFGEQHVTSDGSSATLNPFAGGTFGL